MIKRSTKIVFIKKKKLFNIYDIKAGKILISKKDHYGRKKLIQVLSWI